MILETTLIQGCKPESVTDLVNNKQKYSAVSINRSSHSITLKKYYEKSITVSLLASVPSTDSFDFLRYGTPLWKL